MNKKSMILTTNKENEPTQKTAKNLHKSCK